MNLKEIETILLFGKPRAFSVDEFASQLHSHDIELLREYSEDVSLVVDGRMMTPKEQNLSEELYESKGVQTLNIEVLESALAQEIDADVLLMSLKLSHDKERLKSFIQNSKINDQLFFKLMQMYDWQNEDFFENDDNRDVSAAFIARFYENIERNHNVQYATTGFIHLVAQSQNAELLEVISSLKPLQFHPKIKKAIAMSPFVSVKLQNKFYRVGDPSIKEALSHNKNLDKKLALELFKEEDFACIVTKNKELDDALFEHFIERPSCLASNNSLTLLMQEKLLALSLASVDEALALNDAVDRKTVEVLLAKKSEDLNTLLYANSAMPTTLLEKAYSEGNYFASLAKNEATPVEILYQLQLDSRYERAVKTNAGFGKHIQSENIGWLV